MLLERNGDSSRAACGWLRLLAFVRQFYNFRIVPLKCHEQMTTAGEAARFSQLSSGSTK